MVLDGGNVNIDGQAQILQCLCTDAPCVVGRTGAGDLLILRLLNTTTPYTITYT